MDSRMFLLQCEKYLHERNARRGVTTTQHPGDAGRIGARRLTSALPQEPRTKPGESVPSASLAPHQIRVPRQGVRLVSHPERRICPTITGCHLERRIVDPQIAANIEGHRELRMPERVVVLLDVKGSTVRRSHAVPPGAPAQGGGRTRCVRSPIAVTAVVGLNGMHHFLSSASS